MTRRLRIEWRKGDKVTGRLAMPAQPRDTAILLAHGAGLGQDHAWMVRVREGLAAAGYPTLTFDYPYMEAGRRSPGSPKVNLACHAASADRLAAYCDRVVLAGKSMGGRLGSHVAADGWPAAALVFFGYPLVAPGKMEARDTSHLDAIDAPLLFVSGTRDQLCPLELLEPLVARLGAEAALVEGGGHGFSVRGGPPVEEILDGVVGTTVAWLAERGL